jgi:GNAT superfamily N-acetyltransferase
MIIRIAKASELKEVQELNLKLFKKEHEEYDQTLRLDWTFGKEATKYLKDRISQGSVWVAVIDKQIIGYLCGGITKAEKYRNLQKVGEIENFFVLKDYRSKGAGKKLYQEFIKWCKKNKLHKIKVEATAQNKAGIKFYRNNGFKDHTLVLEGDI